MAWFSKKINSNSIEQLKHDFGEYPPKPLQTEAEAVPFTIVYLNRLSLYFTKLRGLISILSSKDSEIKSKSSLNTKQNFRNQNKKTAEDFSLIYSDLKNNFLESPFLAKILIPIILILILPFGLIYILIKAGPRVLRTTVNMFSIKGSEGVLGYYQYGSGLDSEVNIINKAVKKWSANVDAVISHEHLHLLQHKDGKIVHSEEEDNNFLARISPALEEEGSETTLYFLQAYEVEARLHEVVLSFYRHHGFLPTTYTEFLGLVFSCETYSGDLFENIFKKLDEQFSTYTKYEVYAVRSERAANEIFSAMLPLKGGAAIIIRFVKEVWPIMYSNLLQYYGDEAASKKMLESIPSTLLYEQLYGDGDIYTDSDEGSNTPLVQSSEA